MAITGHRKIRTNSHSWHEICRYYRNNAHGVLRINQAVTRQLQGAALQPDRVRCALPLFLACAVDVRACALDPQARFADYVRDNWNTESGLPQTSALSITQDDTGYIWVGTQNAIARFDGVRFTVFDRDSTGVDTTLASVAHTDKRGDVWFGTPHGALHERDGQFELLHAGQDSAAIVDIGDSTDGTLLFATSLGVMRYDGNSHRSRVARRRSVLQPAAPRCDAMGRRRRRAGAHRCARHRTLSRCRPARTPRASRTSRRIRAGFGSAPPRG